MVGVRAMAGGEAAGEPERRWCLPIHPGHPILEVSEPRFPDERHGFDSTPSLEHDDRAVP